MKICLINPPQVRPKSWGMPRVFPPLGLTYIAAVLEPNHEIQIIDANGEGWRNTKQIENDILYCGLELKKKKKRIRRFNPDVCGITVPFSVANSISIQIADIIKRFDKEIPVIMGGPHPTVRPKQTLENDSVDYVVLGEGEHTIEELLNAIATNRSLKDVKGIVYKENGKIQITERRKYIDDIDSIPFPARHLLPMKEYFAAYKEGRASQLMYVLHERWTTLFTSRGCPFHCIFCSINLTMGRKFRPRSPENVIAEITQLVERFKIGHICFQDDNMTANPKRAKQICKMMIENGFDITWTAPNGIRADTLDSELVNAMKRSGCRRVSLSPESGVQSVVTNIIKKKMDLKKVEDAVTLLNKEGIKVDASFVIGLPGETKEDIWNTIHFALKLKKLGMESAGINMATPLYGTELYEKSIKNGYLIPDETNDFYLSSLEPLISTKEWSKEEIRLFSEIGTWLTSYGFLRKYTALARSVKNPKNRSQIKGTIKGIMGLDSDSIKVLRHLLKAQINSIR
jgi:magnesium-protoporphyrin IX monomethyl ester (oxidative) cyclase